MRLKLPIAATLAGLMAVSSLGIGTASAAPAAKLPAAHQAAGQGAEVIQVQNRKKQRARSSRNNAAAAAAFAGIAGAMIGLAAQESNRDRYYRRGGYYGGNGVYYGNRGYYGGNRGYYGNRNAYRVQPGYRGSNSNYPNPRPDMGAGGHPGNYIGTPPIQNDGTSR